MPTQSSVRSFGGITWRSTNMVYYNLRVQNCKDNFANTTNLAFWSNCFLIKLDGNRFQGQTKSLYPVDSIYVNLSYLILNPLWHQVLAPKTCLKYLKESEIVITTNNIFFKVIFGILTLIIISFSDFVHVFIFLLLHEKFLQSDWFRGVVFQLNLKYLHVKITNVLRVVV